MNVTQCRQCGETIRRRGTKPGQFCSLGCKGTWQREQKAVTRDWLFDQYVTQGKSCYEIGHLVGRDPKRVYEWLVDWGIPTRPRAWSMEATGEKHQDPAWLRREYVEEQRSAAEIAADLGLTAETVLFFLRRFGIARRTISAARAIKRWGLDGEKNGMFGKRGVEAPSWKGGVTPERQAHYSTRAWKEAVKAVWKRDAARCRRCGARQEVRGSFHVHHIASFAVRELRSEPGNLALLCNACHRWVHSKKNTDGAFIASGKGGAL